MNHAAGGKNPITAQANTRILVRIGQLSAATHGEASLHESHPSAQGKHSYESSNEYEDVSPYKITKENDKIK